MHAYSELGGVIVEYMEEFHPWLRSLITREMQIWQCERNYYLGRQTQSDNSNDRRYLWLYDEKEGHKKEIERLLFVFELMYRNYMTSANQIRSFVQ